MTELKLGRYCERHDTDTGERPESTRKLLAFAIADREPTVRVALGCLMGESLLFASMWQAIERHCVLPMDGDDEAEDAGPTGARPSAPPV